MRLIIYLSLIFFTILGSMEGQAVAMQCAPFYDSLNNISSVQANGGAVSGSVSFVPAVNGNGVNLDGTASIRYGTSTANTPSGSVSFWFKKNSADASGGLFQIGTLGTANSIGIFYNGASNLYYELRNSNGDYKTTYAIGTLSSTNYTHITAVWDSRPDGIHLKLFIDGRYVMGDVVAVGFSHTQGAFQLGTVGFYGNGEGVIDEMRLFDHALSDPEVYGEYVYSGNRFTRRATQKPVGTGPVRLINGGLRVNNHEFTVKGVGYQPVPVGYDNTQSTLDYVYSDPAILARDMPMLRAMNVNTVRLWGRLSSTTLLDALYNNGDHPIYAIMTFPVPWDLNYTDPLQIMLLENGIRDYVNTFKNHPAVLAWAIGNENNLHYTGEIRNWYTLANRLAKVAYETEGPSYHPTMVVNGYMLYFGDTRYGSDDLSMNYTDLWGHNSYTGYEFNCYFDYYNALSAKPLIMTEFGVDALNSSSDQVYQNIQADWVVHQWRQIKNNSLGGTVMEYSDEWWKAGNPSTHDYGGYPTDVQPDGFANEEWWGVNAITDNGSGPDTMTARTVYRALGNEYYEAPPGGSPIFKKYDATACCQTGYP